MDCKYSKDKFHTFPRGWQGKSVPHTSTQACSTPCRSSSGGTPRRTPPGSCSRRAGTRRASSSRHGQEEEHDDPVRVRAEAEKPLLSSEWSQQTETVTATSCGKGMSVQRNAQRLSYGGSNNSKRIRSTSDEIRMHMQRRD